MAAHSKYNQFNLPHGINKKLNLCGFILSNFESFCRFIDILIKHVDILGTMV